MSFWQDRRVKTGDLGRRIEDVRDVVSIEELLVACGMPIPDAGERFGDDVQVFCPFHDNTRTPAGSMNVMKGLFNCFACGAAGDVVALAKLHLGTTDVREALDWLEEEFL